MQTWQLFIVPRHPTDISVTVFTDPTKLTNDLYFGGWVEGLKSLWCQDFADRQTYFQYKGTFSE